MSQRESMIFDDNDIKAILAGKKKQTRRIAKTLNWPMLDILRDTRRYPSRNPIWKNGIQACPWYQCCISVIVKEAWRPYVTCCLDDGGVDSGVMYRADQAKVPSCRARRIWNPKMPQVWRPARNMPDWAARLCIFIGKRLRLMKDEAHTADDYKKQWSKVSPKWYHLDTVILPTSLVWMWEFDFTCQSHCDIKIFGKES